MDVGGVRVLGSRSQLKSEPKRKCWTTGNLERTSALYILIMPWVGFSFEHAVGKRVGKRGYYLVDLAPAPPNPGDIKQHRRMLPERAPLDIVNKPHRAEIQVPLPFPLDDHGFRHVGWVGGVVAGAFGGDFNSAAVAGGNGRGVLGAAEEVGEEGMVVEAPNAVRAGGLEGVGFYEPAG